jgi:phosphatidylserine/phosphatidylglycerophosphate/cardiolipin synthase-like enzyme
MIRLVPTRKKPERCLGPWAEGSLRPQERRVLRVPLTLLGGAALLVLIAAKPIIAADIEACFTPPLPRTCDPLATVVKAIDNARTTIRIQMYSLTLDEVVSALVQAKRRGVDVRLIVDRGQFVQDHNESLRIENLAAAGIPVLFDSVPGLMHNKVMVIDGETVLTGSFNYTWGAEHWNAENLLVLRDPELAAVYLRNWNYRAAESKPLRISRLPVFGPVVGNRRSRIYQWPGCPFYGQVGVRNRVEFADAAAAEAAGYRPARNCAP